jgi:hypothetical protein
MEKTCSKCNSTFVCNALDVKNCHCSSVQLEEKTLKELQATYQDCLCQDCLKAVHANQKLD